MQPRAFALRVVRGLARVAACAYPGSFRAAHRLEFAEVAEHLWWLECARRSPWRATMATMKILVADTIKGSPAVWFAALPGTRSPAGFVRMTRSRAAGFIAGGGRDLKLAVRAARRRPAFALLVVLTLGLGIGASATAFDALDRTLLRPLPFAEADRLVHLSMRDVQRGVWATPILDTVMVWRERARLLEQIEIYRQSGVTWHGPAGAEALDALSVSGGLLSMLRVAPLAGRPLLPADAEPGAPAVVMVTEQTWRTRFGGDAGLVGRALMLGLEPRPTTVVGILPAGARIDTTLVPEFLTVLPRGREYPRGAPSAILARMRAGVSPESVEAELRAVTPPEPGASATQVPDATTPAELFLGETFYSGIWLVFAGALALFAVSVVNAGHLLLGRAVARGHELGVRLALGGSPVRLARLFLAEAFVYVGSGLALGVGVMIALERLIHRYEPRLFMEVQGAGLEGRAVWFIGAVAAVALVACAVVPLLRSRSQDLRTIIDSGSASRSTWRGSRTMNAFTITQAAIAVLLVVGAAVMARSFRNLMAVDSGMAIDQLVSIAPSTPRSRDARVAHREQVEAALLAMPTVTGVTTSYTPLLSTSRQDGLPYLDGEAEPPAANQASMGLARVPSDYFEVTGMRIVAGRPFGPDDGLDVAVVNEAFAASRGGNVLGRLLHTPGASRPFRIIGVATNVKSFGIADRQTRYHVYLPEPRPNPSMFVRFFVRTTGDPAMVIEEARRRIAEIDRAIPMLPAEIGSDVIRRQTAQHRFVAVLLSGLAVIGLGLALSGIYGSVALNVSRRTREIGLRMALGSTPRGVIRTIVGAGIRPVMVGGIAGVIGAWLALPYVEVLLYNVSSRDPWSTAAGVSLVVAAAAAASWIPAWRASRVDPALTLRQA